MGVKFIRSKASVDEVFGKTERCIALIMLKYFAFLRSWIKFTH